MHFQALLPVTIYLLFHFITRQVGFSWNDLLSAMTPPTNDEGDSKSRHWQRFYASLNTFSGNSKSQNARPSYFALFRPLQDAQSRLILLVGVVLAIAAGAPLPIIGVIFARIIDAFPPTENEVDTRIYQLLAVGTFIIRFSHYMIVYLQYSHCLFCGYVGLGLLLGYNWRAYLQRFTNSTC
jgi:hypothetical protein